MSFLASEDDSPNQEHDVSKRPRSPTYCSPQSQQKRVPLRDLDENNSPPPRLLPSKLNYEEVESNKQSNSNVEWSDSELKALTDFVLFHTSGESWPSHKQVAFWKSAGEFVKNRRGVGNVCRSGMCNRCLYFIEHLHL